MYFNKREFKSSETTILWCEKECMKNETAGRIEPSIKL